MLLEMKYPFYAPSNASSTSPVTTSLPLCQWRHTYTHFHGTSHSWPDNSRATHLFLLFNNIIKWERRRKWWSCDVALIINTFYNPCSVLFPARHSSVRNPAKIQRNKNSHILPPLCTILARDEIHNNGDECLFYVIFSFTATLRL